MNLQNVIVSFLMNRLSSVVLALLLIGLRATAYTDYNQSDSEYSNYQNGTLISNQETGVEDDSEYLNSPSSIDTSQYATDYDNKHSIKGVAGIYDERNIIENDNKEVALAHPEDPFRLKDSKIDISEGNASLATWYGSGFHGKKTCTGHPYDQNKLSLASRDSQLKGKKVCVRSSPLDGKHKTAMVIDCLPAKSRNDFDLSFKLMKFFTGNPKKVGKIIVQVTLGACEED